MGDTDTDTQIAIDTHRHTYRHGGKIRNKKNMCAFILL